MAGGREIRTGKSMSARCDITTLAILILYGIAGFALLPLYAYQINPDGICYVSIAQKYLGGDFSHAVNGYYGPLLSWLAMPWIASGLAPLTAAKLVNIWMGLIALLGLRSLLHHYRLSAPIVHAVLLSSIPVILCFGLTTLTPDLLLASLLILYLGVMIRIDDPVDTSRPALCGALGGLAYLAKSIGLPFFLVHYSVVYAIRWKQSSPGARALVTRQYAVGLLVFLLISGSWIAILGHKYETLTVGRAGLFNWALVGPESEWWYPIFKGLHPPPNDTAVHALEDPSLYMGKMKMWNPVESWNSVSYLLKLMAKNSLDICLYHVSFNPLAVVFLLGFALILARSPALFFRRMFIAIPLSAVFIYLGGFIPLLIQDRHLCFTFLVALVLGGCILEHLFSREFFRDGNVKALVILLMIASATFTPLRTLVQGAFIQPNRDTYELSRMLREAGYTRGAIASNGHFIETMGLAFHLGSPYYGVVDAKPAGASLEQTLASSQIDYFFFWAPDRTDHPFPAGKYRDVTPAGAQGMRVYRLDSRT
jgi:hypothetical protein